MITPKIFAALLSLFMVFALHTPPAYASNRDAIRNLNVATALFRTEVRISSGCMACGYCRPRAYSKGYLSEEGSYMINTTLYKNYDYVIIGAGDDTVKDLDLDVYDENWNLVSHDSKADNFPVVKVTPRWNGRFHVRVKMYDGHGYPNVAICHLQPE